MERYPFHFSVLQLCLHLHFLLQTRAILTLQIAFNRTIPVGFFRLRKYINVHVAQVKDVSYGDKGRMLKEGEGNESGRDEKKNRKPRFAFQTRSQVDILDDDYRWRKYGQKAVKNQKFPRCYYRCIHQGCNVKKQIQRLSHDEGVVVITHEGIHIHPVQKPSDNFEDILHQMQIHQKS